MAKGNGKTEVNLDLDRELPAAEDEEETGPISIAGKAAYDNARKRAVREQQEFREFAAADVIKNFLPILDSFERALKAGGDSNSNSNSNDFRNGIELIYRQFQDALQKIGVQPMVSVGQPFDPRVHEAVEMVDTTEVADHHVLDELQRGYKYKERLLRPAMVRVARNARG